MATQVLNGKAFEWAVANAMSALTKFEIVEDENSKQAKKCFDEISIKKAEHFTKSALAAVTHILDKEKNSLVSNDFKIRLLADSEGKAGDVRDIVVFNTKFKLGISCKTNHDDLKHSRLSGTSDFVKKWSLDEDGCSELYWEKIRPIFNHLTHVRKSSGRTALFINFEDKANKIYWPILDAFSDELLRLQQKNIMQQNTLCRNLLSYIVGNNDFYKVISLRNEVVIQGFNFNGTLNFQKSKFPKEIIGVDRLNGGVYSKTLRFSGGYTINFRIHNASSRVESSMKFAISAIAFPPKEIYTQNISILEI